jgi:hypothetical protein
VVTVGIGAQALAARDVAGSAPSSASPLVDAGEATTARP